MGLCHQCNNGQETVLLLGCSTCDKSMHTFCLNPRRFMIAQRETWRCNWCLGGDSPVNNNIYDAYLRCSWVTNEAALARHDLQNRFT